MPHQRRTLYGRHQECEALRGLVDEVRGGGSDVLARIGDKWSVLVVSRLGAGPINLDMATPWLAAAIEENIGHDNTVEVGGTQIERAGRIRIAVRIRDIIVRDRDHAVVASAPKAEVRLSGMALLTGRLRAESLNLVDATLAVRITPDGYVTVSTGDNARPLATATDVAPPIAAAGRLTPYRRRT